MTTVKIKQLNNDAASTGQVITFDGSDNVWAIQSGLTVVTTFAGLPGSPSTNDIVFYVPFNSVITFDGTDWVGPKITIPLFGREGVGNNDVWLEGIGRADAHPTGPPLNLTHGYIFAGIDTTSVNRWKLYNLTVDSSQDVTGDMEIHTNATSLSPTFGSTGIVKATMTAQSHLSTNVTPTALDISNSVQCYWRHTSGTWADWTVTITYAFAAGP